MREVECLCGEKVVFLDAEVQAKTCPNCGAPVYQYGVPRMFEERVRRRRPSPWSSQGLWVAGLLSVVLLAVIVVAALSVARTRALGRARLDEERADAARLRGDYNTAEELYRRAMDAYRRWGGESDTVAKIGAALDEVTLALKREAGADGSRAQGPMPISLEELARQAYLGDPREWEDRFNMGYAGRWVLVKSPVERREATRFRPAALSLSYMMLSTQGPPVAVVFDGPFFEKFGIEAGDETVVRAVLSAMRFEKGTADEAGQWVLVFDGLQSTLVTDENTLKEVGWEPDDELSALLARQAVVSSAF
ncbi:MAG: tetratricopeptide repeat protein [Planctomycetota bacterium]